MSEKFVNPVNTEIILLLQDAATVKLGRVGVTKARSRVQYT